jgi:alpha/beta superfamily hydrolase
MVAIPTWILRDGTALFAWIHQPASGVARGAVVLCPPLGREHFCSYVTLREMADRFAERDVLTVRFDYAGTGDSSGDWHSCDQLDEWQESIRVMVDAVREQGIEDVALVGLRIGATLAAKATERVRQLRSLVLWDPVASGSRYIREQRALYQMFVTLSESADVAIDLPGITLNPQTGEELRGLKVDRIEWSSLPGADPAVLLLTRPERSSGGGLAALMRHPRVRHAVANGQERLLDVPSYDAVPPRDTVATVVDWVTNRFDDAPRRFQEISPRSEAVVGVTADGQPVVERIVALGPNGLFGVTTGTRTTPRTRLMCVNAGTEHHIGPSRLWVTLARRAAECGVQTTRFDRRGVGDTVNPDNSLFDAQTMYSSAAVTDIEHAMRDLSETSSPEAPQSAIIGLCSGAWSAARAAADLKVGRIFLVNPGWWLPDPPRLRSDDNPAKTQISEQLMSDDPFVADLSVTGSARSRARQLIKRHIPYWAWLLLGRHGLIQVPEVLIGLLDRQETETTLFFAELDGAAFDRQRGLKAIERLGRRGWTVEVHRIATADHALLAHEGREAVQEAVVRALSSLTAP